MHVTNSTGDDRYVPAVGDWVKAGAEVEVDSEVGQALVDQGWKSAAQKAAQKRARTQRAEQADEAPTTEATEADPQED